MPKGGMVKADRSLLDKLVKALSDTQVVQIGIFGKKTGRHEAGKVSPAGGHKKSKQASTQTNAELGFIHELGSFSRKIPPRSFLRMPIHFQAKRIGSEALVGSKKLLLEGKKTMILKRIGIAAEKAILRAFETGGFGFWPKLQPKTIRGKRSSKPLIDTGQLRRAIASRVGSPAAS